jgi:hypothetical protein
LPVPVRVEVCGLLIALSLTLNVPVLVPVAVDVNTTLITQMSSGFKLVPQVVPETLKSPVVAIAMLSSAAPFCLLVKVNTFGRRAVPTFCAGYFAATGASVA